VVGGFVANMRVTDRVWQMTLMQPAVLNAIVKRSTSSTTSVTLATIRRRLGYLISITLYVALQCQHTAETVYATWLDRGYVYMI